MFDENGAVLKEVTSDRAEDIEIETSVALFGDNFLPPDLAETISQQIGGDPEDFRRNEIILHAETGIEEDLHFASLRFSFSEKMPWQTGTYEIYGMPKEFWLQRLRTLWENFRDHGFLKYEGRQQWLEELRKFQEMMRDHREEGRGVQDQNLLFDSNVAEPGINANYFEFGFGLPHTKFMYVSSGGELELEHVSDDRVEGSFSAGLKSTSASLTSGRWFVNNWNFCLTRLNGLQTNLATGPPEFIWVMLQKELMIF